MSDPSLKKKRASRFIPCEVLENILLRLPLKSIARFRCVSKSWQRLVRDPLFVHTHFEQFKRNKSDLTVFTTVNGRLHSLNIKSGNLEVVKIEAISGFTIHICEIWGSCNGLLCITTYSPGNCLLNPYTWECNTISNSKTPRTYYTGIYDSGIGFGYNTRLKSFEVVRVSRDGLKSQLEVCTVGQDLWRKIIDDIPYKGYSQKGKLVNGAIHWAAKHWSNLSTDENVIIAYDIGNQKVGEIPLPERRNKNWPDIDVGVLDSYLCVYVSVGFYTTNVELWIMIDYGAKDSWTKLFSTLTCCVIPDKLIPLYIMENGSKILLKDAHYLYLCDTRDQTETVKKIKQR